MQTAKNLATGYIVRAQKSQPLRLPFGQTIGSTAHKLDPKPAKTGPMGGWLGVAIVPTDSTACTTVKRWQMV